MTSRGSIPLVSPWLYRRSVRRVASRAAAGDIPAVRELAAVFCTAADPMAGSIAGRGLRALVSPEQAGLLCREALARDESCGAHFRVEHQHPDGEAKRDDANFTHVAAWEFKGEGADPERHVEPLQFNLIKPAVRSYK